MRQRLIGTTLAAILLAAGIAPLGAMSSAHALKVRCDTTGCKVYCTQQLPNGNTVEYEDGTNITVTTPDGTEHKFTCKNGQWVRASVIQLPGWRGVIGTIGVGSIGGIRGDVESQDCNDSPEPVCTDVSYSVGPPGLSTASSPCTGLEVANCPE